MSETQAAVTSVPVTVAKEEKNPLLPTLERMRAAFIEHGSPSYAERRQHLDALGKAIAKYQDELVEAVMADFGHRSKHETFVAEVLGALAELRSTKANLKKWMKPKTVPWSMMGGLAKGKIVYQPKGVVGIMSPFNYPVYLIFSPLVDVLAAGNRAMIKPSDLTPRTGEVVKKMMAEFFDPDYVTVITGDVQTSIWFSELPFDHLVYTGGTEVARSVMQAAAKNLTPVTLELGGKSPAIISENYPIQSAVNSILLGKLVNSGQTCIAPDYVMLPESRVEEFVNTITSEIASRYPYLKDNPDITWIINDRHFSRIKGLIEDARKKGANVIQINPKNEDIPEGARVIPPTIITGVNDDMLVMQQEIFGPVIPVMTYKRIEDAIRYINSHPRPLALYYFDNNKKQVDLVINQTISGGACVNETMLHISHEHLPFGGVGTSGIGHYHGFEGFKEFSHQKSTLYQNPRFSPASMIKQPYPEQIRGRNLMDLLKSAVNFLSR